MSNWRHTLTLLLNTASNHKFKVEDLYKVVQFSKYENILSKGYTPN